MNRVLSLLTLLSALFLSGCGYNTIQTNDEQVKAAWAEVLNQYQRRALSRLLLVTENYPNLKANQGFRDLQTQLEGTENRITVARNRYIKSVQEYNITVRSFPNNLTAMVMGYEVKPSFTVANEAAISKPPTVDFGTK